jgi:hypothetical protein
MALLSKETDLPDRHLQPKLAAPFTFSMIVLPCPHDSFISHR